MSYYSITFISENTGGNYIITSAAGPNKVIDRKLIWDENYPRQLQVVLDNQITGSSYNLVHPSFSGWAGGSGTAPLSIGDKITYVITDMADTSITIFTGFVTDLKQTDGQLTVSGRDYLYCLDEMKDREKIIYDTYRDHVGKGDGGMVYYGDRLCWTLESIDADMVMPATLVEFGLDDSILLSETTQRTTPADSYWVDASDELVAQPFMATQNALYGVRFHYFCASASGNTSDIKVSIQADNGSDEPDGSNLAFTTTTPTADDAWHETDKLFNVSGAAVPLVKGQKYWVVFSPSGTTTTVSWEIQKDVDGPYSIDGTAEYKYDIGAGWVAVSDDNLLLKIFCFEYYSIDTDSYFHDATNNRLVITEMPGSFISSPATLAPNRGRVSYYYGSVVLEDVAHDIIGLDPTVSPNISTNCDRTFGVYRLQGKSIGDALRELADVPENSGTWSGYQHTVASSSSVIYMAKRYKVGDTPAYTFSRGSTIISASLSKSSRGRPASVLVTGRASDGSPVIAYRDDQGTTATAGSFRAKSKLKSVKYINDDSIMSLAEADKTAWAYLQSVQRDEWEGEITLSGRYPGLMSYSSASTNFGSGVIITLTYAPLGIDAQDFKVTGITLGPNETVARITNIDRLRDNKYTAAMRRLDSLESFSPETNPNKTTFFTCYSTTTVTDADVWMQLCSADDTAITNHRRVKCTKFTSPSPYNINTYHAEFDGTNGYTIDGTSEVTRIELYDAETAGSQLAEYAMTTYYYFPKWKGTSVIVDFNAHQA